MEKIKIVFFDIDGTLLDMNGRGISHKTIEALRQLQSNDILICIATGRSPMGLPKIEGIKFDAFLTYNGSFCYNQKHTILSNPLQKADVHTIIKNATTMQRPLSLATKDKLASNGKDKELVQYFGFANLEVEIADDFEKVSKEDVYQIMMGCREEEYSQIMQDVHDAKIASWWDKAADIIPLSGGKGKGIEKVLDYYHLDKSEAMAFGDGNNDIEMFQAVGSAIAMANASDKLKIIADDICGDVANDGVYYYLSEHHLI